MIHARHTTAEGATPRRGIGLSPTTVVLLAAIAAVRVPLHDLGIVEEGDVLAPLLVFVPPAIWLIVVLRRRAPNPLLALTVVGLAYGVMLAVIHQLFWGAAFGGGGPGLGGSLEGALDPGLESMILRAASIPSSIATGTVVGALTGAAARAIGCLLRT